MNSAAHFSLLKPSARNNKSLIFDKKQTFRKIVSIIQKYFTKVSLASITNRLLHDLVSKSWKSNQNPRLGDISLPDIELNNDQF